MKVLVDEILRTVEMPSENEKRRNRALARQALNLLRRLMSTDENLKIIRRKKNE